MDFINLAAASRIQMSSPNSQSQQAATAETTNSNATVEQQQEYADEGILFISFPRWKQTVGLMHLSAFKITNSGLICEQQEKLFDAGREAPEKSTG